MDLLSQSNTSDHQLERKEDVCDTVVQKQSLPNQPKVPKVSKKIIKMQNQVIEKQDELLRSVKTTVKAEMK